MRFLNGNRRISWPSEKVRITARRSTRVSCLAASINVRPMLTPGPGPSNVPTYCHDHGTAGGRFDFLGSTPAGLLIRAESQLPAIDSLGPNTQQPSQSGNPQAQQPVNPSAIHSLLVGLRAGAFMVRLASRATQVRFCWLVRLTPHMPSWAAP